MSNNYKTFDWISYVRRYPDLKNANINTKEKAFLHWNNHGKNEGRIINNIENINIVKKNQFIYQSPTNNYFNKKFYKNTYNLHDINENELINHYTSIGYKMNYNPSLYFNTKWYMETYKIKENMDPLTHFISNLKSSIFKPNELCTYFIRFNVNEPWVSTRGDFIPLSNQKKKINFILPGINNSITGGPQTIYLFANMLANNNYNVRIISMFEPVSPDFITEINKRMKFNKNIELETQFNNDILISYDDIFIISAWWTAYPLKYILGYLNIKKFIWMIQENELIFHMGDNIYQKALDTYNMDYISLVHSSILLDGLKSINFGPFKNQEYLSNNCIAFEPAINNDDFYYIPKERNSTNKIKIIFYSRNSTPRNLHSLIIDTLKNSYHNELINNINFEIIGFGEKIGRYNLCYDFFYEDYGFLNLDKYSELFRESDILINLLMSPIIGPVPLEMASCNGICIHNNYLYKNQETVSKYSDKIIMCEPNVLDLTEGLNKAIQIVRSNKISNDFPKLIHKNWDDSLKCCLDFLKIKLNMDNYL